MSSSPNLNRLEYFVTIVEEGSITAAARRLGISKAVVSKQLQLLEQDLSVSLLRRTSRQMTLTEAGEEFYRRATHAVSEARQAYDSARRVGEVPSGTLRITAPVDFGLAHVAQTAAKFSDRFPEVTCELVFSDEKFDLVEASFDISIRTGWLTDSSYRARKLGEFRQFALASPGFLDRHGILSGPQALEPLPFAEVRALAQPRNWVFTGADGAVQPISIARASVSVDVTLAARIAALSDAAFTILPDFAVEDALTSGALVPMLPGWTLPRGGIYAVFPPSRHRSAAARLFVDALAARIHEASPD